MILTNVLPQWMSKVVFQILATIIGKKRDMMEYN